MFTEKNLETHTEYNQEESGAYGLKNVNKMLACSSAFLLLLLLLLFLFCFVLFFSLLVCLFFLFAIRTSQLTGEPCRS